MPAFRTRRRPYQINQLCGSGLRTVALAIAGHPAGRQLDIVVAGGQESMSLRRPTWRILRNGTKMGDVKFARYHDQGRPAGAPSTAITWATRPRTWRAVNGSSPATSRTPSRPALSRRPKRPKRDNKFADEITCRSSSRPARARSSIDTDEHPKPGTTAESLAKSAPGLRQGRHGDRRQRQRHQRRRRRGGADEGRSGRRGAAAFAARQDRLLGDLRASTRRSWAPGRSRPAAWPWSGRLDHRRPRPGRGQRGLRRTGAGGQQGHGLGRRQGERQRRRHRPGPSPSVPRARGS